MVEAIVNNGAANSNDGGHDKLAELFLGDEADDGFANKGSQN